MAWDEWESIVFTGRELTATTHGVVVEHVVDDGHADLLQAGRLEDLFAGVCVGDVKRAGLGARCRVDKRGLADVQVEVLERGHRVQQLAQLITKLHSHLS